MKKVLLYASFSLFLISYGTSNYEANRYVKVKGLPETDFYLLK